jgi:hypothetical protein
MTLENQPRALREPTKQFLDQCGAGIFVPYLSTVVLQEIALAGYEQVLLIHTPFEVMQ